MFPSGRPGVALVIVRLSLAGMLLLHAYRFVPIALLSWPAALLVLIAMALFAGVTTAIVSVLYCLAEAAFLLTDARFDPSVLTLSIPVAIALVLLGPGAYSVDARVFGRRVIVLPPDSSKQ